MIGDVSLPDIGHLSLKTKLLAKYFSMSKCINREKLHKFHNSPHDVEQSDISLHERCGELSDFSTSVKYRYLNVL